MLVPSVATCCIYTMHTMWPKIRAYFYTVFETALQTHMFNSSFSGTTCVGWYQKGKTNLDLQSYLPRDNGISWAICKTVPRSRQNTPAPHHSVFYRLNAFPAAQPTASAHCYIIKIRLLTQIGIKFHINCIMLPYS